MTHSCWSPPGSWSVARRYRCTEGETPSADRKSTRLNSSHITISYAVFCLKKKKKTNENTTTETKQTNNNSHAHAPDTPRDLHTLPRAKTNRRHRSQSDQHNIPGVTVRNEP